MAMTIKHTGTRKVNHASFFLGMLFNLWYGAKFLNKLTQENRQYMLNIADIQGIHTRIDFYSHNTVIKYISRLVFVGFLPAVFIYLDRTIQSVPIGKTESLFINQ